MPCVTYSELKNIISESITSVLLESLLLESQESKSISEAIRLYMDRTGKSREEAEEFIRITLRSSVPTLRDKQTAKFILGVTRMALDGQLRDATAISNLNSTLKYVRDPTHINEYDRNLNGLSAEELIGRFATVRTQDMEKDKAEIRKSQFQEKKEYKVIRIDSFDQIRQYGKYNDWCLAQDNGKNMYDTYTSNGVNQLYLILRDGFENEPRQAGPNTPYDAYGLSMMTVIVDPDGQMTQSTTRWNHENGSSDSAFTPKQISEIIGRNFYDVFKPNTKFKDALENALTRVRNGESLENIFDAVKEMSNGMMAVELMVKCNILTQDNTILFSRWVDGIGDFYEGFVKVYIKGSGWNFINTNGEIISKVWFDGVKNFQDGFAKVYIQGKGYNLINTSGEIISRVWFDSIGEFNEGLAWVNIEGKGQNFINRNGDIFSKVWFDYISLFYNGFANVKIDGKGYNFINKNRDFISNIWFDSIGPFHEGFAAVNIDENGWNFINTNGEFISKVWFDSVRGFIGGFAGVNINKKGYNFINTNGEIISKVWFDNVGNFIEGCAGVKIDEKGCNFINRNGEIISKVWFDNVRNFRDGVALVQLKGEDYYLGTNGKLSKSRIDILNSYKVRENISEI